LREKSLTAETARERKCGLAIAHVMEGMPRVEAGRLTDQTDQAVKDAIKRYNAEGFAGLKDRAHTGRPRKRDLTFPANITPIKLLPYAPETNPIERVWGT
jgi:transposase